MTSKIDSLEQVRAFLEGTEHVGFVAPVRSERHAWIAQSLVSLGYGRLKRKERGMVRAYIGRVTGLSRAQVARLIAQYRKTGRIEDLRRAPAKPFRTRYTAADAALLAEVWTSDTERCLARPPRSSVSVNSRSSGTLASNA